MAEEAIRLFQLAGELEGQGEMKEAVKTYKQAFRLRDDVDVLYRKMRMLEIGQPEDKEAAEKPEIQPKGGCYLSRLPAELIAKILFYLAQDSLKAYKRAQKSGRVFWIPHDSALFWEPMCLGTYQDATLHAHKYISWYEMFRKRPTMRYDGVYVATCRYYREGEQEGSSWFPPTIEVIYYRYLRFLPNGSLQSLLSNDPPTTMLPFLDSPKAFEGKWELDAETGELKIETRGPVKHYILHMDLRVTSSGGKLHNKLKWQNYRFLNTLQNSYGEFDLKNDKSFFFHRA